MQNYLCDFMKPCKCKTMDYCCGTDRQTDRQTDKYNKVQTLKSRDITGHFGDHLPSQSLD